MVPIKVIGMCVFWKLIQENRLFHMVNFLRGYQLTFSQNFFGTMQVFKKLAQTFYNLIFLL